MITWYVIRYLEDFKTSNIEDTDKAGSLSGCFVERFINSIYDPLEELLVKGLWKGFNNEINFIFWLSFCDIFTTDLKIMIYYTCTKNVLYIYLYNNDKSIFVNINCVCHFCLQFLQQNDLCLIWKDDRDFLCFLHHFNTSARRV